MDCGSPLPLFGGPWNVPKRQGTGAVQNLADYWPVHGEQIHRVYGCGHPSFMGQKVGQCNSGPHLSPAIGLDLLGSFHVFRNPYGHHEPLVGRVALPRRPNIRAEQQLRPALSTMTAQELNAAVAAWQKGARSRDT